MTSTWRSHPMITFPSAMHIAYTITIEANHSGSAAVARYAIDPKASEWADVVKIGRTHLGRDAIDGGPGMVRLRRAALEDAIADLEHSSRELLQARDGRNGCRNGNQRASELRSRRRRGARPADGLRLTVATNSLQRRQRWIGWCVRTQASKTTAVALYKIGNDLRRWLGSGSANGPAGVDLAVHGTRFVIMPGKVNPTQAEALSWCASR